MSDEVLKLEIVLRMLLLGIVPTTTFHMRFSRSSIFNQPRSGGVFCVW